MRKRIVLAALALLVIGGGLAVAHFAPLGRIGAGYAAEQTCACVFVSGRALDSCRGDLDPLAQKLVSIDVGKDEVRTRSAGILHARARFDAATGCTLVE